MSKNGKIVLIIIFILLFLGLIFFSGLVIYLAYKAIKSYDGNSTTTTEQVTIKSSWQLASSLQSFSEEEYDEFTKNLIEDLKKQNENYKYSLSEIGGLDFSLETEEAVPPTAVPKADGLGGAIETITNVQEAGVDEGDIVKAYGDYLVILRRGRIFTIQVKDGDKNLLTPVYKADAYPKGYTNGAWYDEMLIYQDTVIVIGYSYAMKATEVGLFKLNDQGQITHEDTYFIDSNDYYSSRNYTSRLINDKLLFYMPYYLVDWNYYENEYRPTTKLPKIKKWISENKTTNGKTLLDKTDIYKPVQDTATPTLHTVVACDLASKDFNCRAQAILGPYSRNFYVSPNAVYIWVSNYDYNSSTTKAKAYVYAMPLNMQGVGVIKAYGSPLDQFSFKETDDYLYVLVQGKGFGDAMWNPEYSDSDFSLARLPLKKFNDQPTAIDKKHYKTLPDLKGHNVQNRFVGDYILYGSGSSWWSEEKNDDPLYIVNYKNRGVSQLKLAGGVDRIEVLDSNNAVVIGKNSKDLLFHWVSLPNTLIDTYTLENAVQGETRSHGFFFSAKDNILGLPIKQSNSQGYEQLWYQSAAIKYLKVDRDSQEFKDLGSLYSSEDDRAKKLTAADDDCLYSCVDWYGNSRPIFYDERIFALMGYELIEGELLWSGDIKEKARINYYQEL